MSYPYPYFTKTAPLRESYGRWETRSQHGQVLAKTSTVAVVETREESGEKGNRSLLEPLRVLCSTQALSIRMICISLFLFESLKQNFHIGLFPQRKFPYSLEFPHWLNSKQIKSCSRDTGISNHALFIGLRTDGSPPVKITPFDHTSP